MPRSLRHASQPYLLQSLPLHTLRHTRHTLIRQIHQMRYYSFIVALQAIPHVGRATRARLFCYAITAPHYMLRSARIFALLVENTIIPSRFIFLHSHTYLPITAPATTLLPAPAILPPCCNISQALLSAMLASRSRYQMPFRYR